MEFSICFYSLFMRDIRLYHPTRKNLGVEMYNHHPRSWIFALEFILDLHQNVVGICLEQNLRDESFY